MTEKNQIEAFIHFFCNMDIEMIDAILDDGITFQDFEKPVFLHKLQKVFDVFKNNGDTKFLIINGSCNTCNKCDNGISFVGEKTGNYIDIIIKTKNERIFDLFECSDFLNTDTTIRKRRRIYLDKFHYNTNFDIDF